MLILIVLLSLATLFILCLSLPLEIAIRLDFSQRVTLRLRVLWLFGLVKRELGWGDGAAALAGLSRSGRRFEGIAGAFRGMRQVKGLWGRFLRLLKNCLRSLKLKEFVARLKIGLDSPADTGLLFAYLSPLGLLSLFPGCDIDIQPSFEHDAIIQGYLSAVVSVMPVRLLMAVAGFVLSVPVIGAFASALGERWKRRSGRERPYPSAILPLCP